MDQAPINDQCMAGTMAQHCEHILACRNQKPSRQLPRVEANGTLQPSCEVQKLPGVFEQFALLLCEVSVQVYRPISKQFVNNNLEK
jgi:hypothetical protein